MKKVGGQMSRVERGTCPEHLYCQKQKSLLIQPIVKEGCLGYFPAMLHEAGAWLEHLERKSMIVEIPDQWTNIHGYLPEYG